MLSRERDEFQRLYPQATLRLEPGTSRDAVRALFAAEADLAVIARDLTPEERRSAVEGNLALEGYRFARGAVVTVVHPSNPVENLTLEDLRGIYMGTTTRWSAFGGAARDIMPVFQSVDADITEFFVESVLGGEPLRVGGRPAPSDSAAVERVARTPDAIAYVSLGVGLERVRVVRLATLKGLPYWKPDLEAVHRGNYPLTRFFNLYVRADGPQLANGFITYVTSMDGQRLVQQAGLVPTTVPVRFVRRSPMWSSHTPGDSIPTP